MIELFVNGELVREQKKRFWPILRY